jgi:minichromosome maintenance protein 10
MRRKRILSHSEVQDRLYGRYFLTPSLLYSVVRLSRDGATYDVPVESDWVTMAVVAERGEVKVSGTRDTGGEDDEDDDDVEVGEQDESAVAGSSSGNVGPGKPAATEKKRQPWDKRPDKQKDNQAKANRRGPRKYINLKLCSLPSRSSSSSSSSSTTGGDALLQLLLFQADHAIRKEVVNEDGEKVDHTVYKGGSGGAYEKWCNLNVGSVIAILNPRVLRPLRVSHHASHHALTSLHRPCYERVQQCSD